MTRYLLLTHEVSGIGGVSEVIPERPCAEEEVTVGRVRSLGVKERHLAAGWVTLALGKTRRRVDHRSEIPGGGNGNFSEVLVELLVFY